MSGSDDMNFHPDDNEMDEWDRDRHNHFHGPSNGASDWEMGAGQIVELPKTEIWKVWAEDEKDYDDLGEAICYFEEQHEAEAYALRRNDVANDHRTYTAERVPLGPPDVAYDGPYWIVDFDLQWHYDKHERRTITDLARQLWWCGNNPGKAKVTRNNGRNFGVTGTDFESVISLATETARKNVLAEAERREIEARKKAEATRFRIDSQHEFG